ncbi:MAG: ATP-binding protein [Segetibacter sp.]
MAKLKKIWKEFFTAAEQKNWILFFDEADALFGKRSSVQSSHDKYANQEVSYLLQRLEDFSGLVILASNYKSNLDAAFIRRFSAIVPFPMPNAEERYNIWEKSLPAVIPIEASVDLKLIAKKYEISGSSILNIIHYVALKAIAKKDLIDNRFRSAGRDLAGNLRRKISW